MSGAPAVRLREVRDDDLETLWAQQADPEACAMANFTSRPRDAFLEHWRGIAADETVYARTVELDGEVAGYVVCFVRSGIRQVGYWLGREYWGRGLATRALADALDEIAERPLHAFVAPDNVGSRRVLEKCGFRRSAEGLRDPSLPDAEDDLLYRLDAS